MMVPITAAITIPIGRTLVAKRRSLVSVGHGLGLIARPPRRGPSAHCR